MKKFTSAFEDIFVEFLLTNQELFEKTCNITRPEYFNEPNRQIVELMINYAREYNRLPDREQIKAELELPVVGNPQFDTADPRQIEWFLSDYEEFCKGRAYGLTFRSVLEDVNEGNYDAVPDKINKVADEVMLISDLGREFAVSPKNTLFELLNETEKTTSGWPAVDTKLGGGFVRGGLQIFMGISGQGKSVFLANIAMNYALMGKNVLYVSLEMSEAEIELRLLRMLTGQSDWWMKNNSLEACQLIEEKRTDVKGRIFVKQFPAKSVSGAYMRSLLKEYQRSDIKIDALVCDYIDLMNTNDRKRREKYEHDENVAIELRNVAMTEDVFAITATQMNRSGMQQSREGGAFGHENMAGGVGKGHTADSIMAIKSTKDLREKGEVELQFVKVRNSTDLGSVRLNFNKSSLRVTDPSAELDKHRPDSAQDFNATLNANEAERKAKELGSVLAKLDGSDFSGRKPKPKRKGNRK